MARLNVKSQNHAQSQKTTERAQNMLDPNVTTEEDIREVPLIVKVYGILCIISGVATLPSIAAFFGSTLLSLVHGNATVHVTGDLWLSVWLVIVGIILSAFTSIVLITFGITLVRSRRRWAAQLSYVLIAITAAEVLVDIMLQGIGLYLIRPVGQLIILTALSATVDPALRQERELQRRLRDMINREAAHDEMLGRDETGEGYIKLNYLNLFWVFVACSILGLVLEDIWHMVIDEPGVFQDRSGMLFGPFSPIYGFGAAIMTMALNRFYRKSPVAIFLVSCVLGSGFEIFVGWFMQVAFGVISWSYTKVTIFGLPDPIVILTGGRACTQMTCLWGVGGLLWIKFCLPRLLKLINKIPWTWRYSVTVISTVLMLIDGVMTLQSLDYWYLRSAGAAGTSPIAQFYNEHFDDAYMKHRFQSMSMDPNNTSRVQDMNQA